MKRIFVAGHRGMVGSAICKKLRQDSGVQILTCSRDTLDLCNQSDVEYYFKTEKPDEVILAAAKVGGIHANNIHPADFIYQNLQIQNNIIHSAHVNNVQKLLFLGSSCIYPRLVKQPMSEDDLLTGVLEPTNEPYAIAKIAGIKMCESYNRQYGRDYRSVMPTNLYGPGDNYHAEHSHVVPALLRKFHEAKINGDASVLLWGSGRPKREFLYVGDMADASIFIHQLDKEVIKNITSPTCSHINIGSGAECTIEQLAKLVRDVVCFDGKIFFDHEKPDGPPRKLLNTSKLNSLGWHPKKSIVEGLQESYEDFVNNYDTIRK